MGLPSYKTRCTKFKVSGKISIRQGESVDWEVPEALMIALPQSKRQMTSELAATFLPYYSKNIFKNGQGGHKLNAPQGPCAEEDKGHLLKSPKEMVAQWWKMLVYLYI